jgi:hypothetical protein
MRLDAPMEVPLRSGGKLRGEAGDWLLQYAQSD